MKISFREKMINYVASMAHFDRLALEALKVVGPEGLCVEWAKFYDYDPAKNTVTLAYIDRYSGEKYIEIPADLFEGSKKAVELYKAVTAQKAERTEAEEIELLRQLKAKYEGKSYTLYDELKNHVVRVASVEEAKTLVASYAGEQDRVIFADGWEPFEDYEFAYIDTPIDDGEEDGSYWKRWSSIFFFLVKDD